MPNTLTTYPRRIIIIFAFCIFGLINSEFSIIAVLPFISTAFDITQAQAGYLLTAFSLSVCILGPLSVNFFSHYRPKKTIVFSLSILILSNIMGIYSTNYLTIMISRILPAFVHTLLWSIFLTLAPECFKPQEKAKAISLINIGSISAIVIGMPLSYFLTVTFNWKACFYLSIVMDLFAILLVLFFLPNIKAPSKRTFKHHRSILYKPSIILAMISGTLVFTAMYSIYTYWTLYLQTKSQFTTSQISLLFFLFGFMGYIGNYILGKITKPHNTQTVLTTVLLLLMTAYSFIYGLPKSFIVILLFTCLWGGFQNSIGTALQPFVTQNTNTSTQFANSLFIALINLGIALGSYIGGLTQKIIGIQYVPITAMVCLVLSMLTIFASTRFRSN